MWVYIKTEPRLWTVGFYHTQRYAEGRPQDKWITDSDHDNQMCAAKRVSFLNGSPDNTFIPTCSCGGLM